MSLRVRIVGGCMSEVVTGHFFPCAWIRSPSATLLEGRLSKRPDGGRLARIRKAPLKIVGFFSDCQENSRATMSAKSADEHRARARHVRQLAQTMTSPE